MIMAELVYRTASAGYPTRYQGNGRVTRVEALLREAKRNGLPDSAISKLLCSLRAV